jgi:hypothetical protein
MKQWLRRGKRMAEYLCTTDGDTVEMPDGTSFSISICGEPWSDELDAKNYLMAKKVADAFNLAILARRVFNDD